MKSLKKTALVTGAGNGLGRALTLQLIKLDYFVIAVDINQLYLEETLALTNPNNIMIEKIDITNYEELSLLFKKITKEFSALDLLINNAGIIQPFVDVETLSDEQIKKVMDINFFSAVNIVKLALPLLKLSSHSNIVNISSMGAFAAVPGQTIYGASKAALKMFSEGLASELKDTNVKVTIIMPGAMSTNIAKNSNVDLKVKENAQNNNLIMPIDKAATKVIKAFQKNKFIYYLGKDSKILKISHKISPKLTLNLIAKMMKAYNK